MNVNNKDYYLNIGWYTCVTVTFEVEQIDFLKYQPDWSTID